ncbi:MAG: hypothetical protein ACPG77_00940, partial [Nannocystaceae bacterium]
IAPERMHALRGAPDYDRLAPVLGSLTHVGHVKALVSTCQQMLVDFDDPRLVEHIRTYPDCHVLDPVYGFASYLYRHGSPSSDLALVHNCLGATNLDAGYQAMAVLADWGVAGQAQQLLDALDYTSAHAWAALRALLLHPFLSPVISIEALLDRIAARGLSGPDRAALWPILEQLANNEPLASQFTTWANNSGQLPQWERFFEATLRLEVPRPYRLGAQSASFRIFATLLPDVFTRFSARILADSPDRFALDLLEYLGRHHPELAATYASHHLTSGHWGMRTCARKIATRLK